MQSHVQFEDPDQFVQHIDAIGWQGRVEQTGSGAFKVELSMYSDRGVAAIRTSYSLANFREVSTPGHARTFGIVRPAATTNTWCHARFDGPIVQMMPRSDYRASNAGGHIGYQIAIDDDLVAELLEQLELPEKMTDAARWHQINDRNARTLKDRMDQLWGGSVTGASDAQEIVLDELAAMFLGTFSSKGVVFHDKPLVRARALNLAINYMEAHLSDSMSLADVARDTGACRRTLTQAFREGTGLSPMAYLKLMRLNQVKRMLLKAPQTAQVVDLANVAGFWHMGQFARDYRKLFGELPSATLSRHPL